MIPAILAVFALAYCGAGDSRRDATTVGSDGWVFEGWACAPDAAKALEGLSPAEYCQDERSKAALLLRQYCTRVLVESRSGIDLDELARRLRTEHAIRILNPTGKHVTFFLKVRAPAH